MFKVSVSRTAACIALWLVLAGCTSGRTPDAIAITSPPALLGLPGPEYLEPGAVDILIGVWANGQTRGRISRRGPDELRLDATSSTSFPWSEMVPSMVVREWQGDWLFGAFSKGLPRTGSWYAQLRLVTPDNLCFQHVDKVIPTAQGQCFVRCVAQPGVDPATANAERFDCDRCVPGAYVIAPPSHPSDIATDHAVLEIIGRKLVIPVSKIQIEKPFKEQENAADTLDLVEMEMAIEDELNIVLTAAEVDSATCVAGFKDEPSRTTIQRFMHLVRTVYVRKLNAN